MTAPGVEEWAPGTVHPTGGYDEVISKHGETLYRLNGRRHRLDGPAGVIVFRGVTIEERWWRHDRLHRDGGPAVTVLRRSGELDGQEWRSNGLRHRIDGPAVFGYDEFGVIEHSSWYVRGHYLSSTTFGLFREALDAGSPEEWALAFALGDFR